MNNIREIRKKRGFTQKQLANALGVTESAVSHIDTLLGRDGTNVDELSEYLTAIINSPERRKLLDLTMWMPKDKLQKLIKLVEVWNE